MTKRSLTAWIVWLAVGAPASFVGVWQLSHSMIQKGFIDYGCLTPIWILSGLAILASCVYGLSKMMNEFRDWIMLGAVLAYAVLFGGFMIVGGLLISCFNGDCL